MSQVNWHGKPYYSLDAWCKNHFSHKCYKIALNAHMTCPNRDGTLGTRGCIFCSGTGSGEFSAPARGDIPKQLAQAKAQVEQKNKGGKYIAYFQSFTNTYGPLPYLEAIFRQAMAPEDVAALSIATRPDCLPPAVVELLQTLSRGWNWGCKPSTWRPPGISAGATTWRCMTTRSGV